MASASHHVPLPRLVAFALPGVAIGALAVSLSVYLPHYYAAHAGLALAAVGTAFAIIRFGDMFLDPLIGVAMDRTRTPLGRYRIWLIAGAPVLMLAVARLFMPPAKVDLVYLAGWLFLYYAGFSMLVLAHSAWASVLAARYHERSRVFGVIQLISIAGAALVLVLPVMLARRDGSSGAGGVAAMGWFIVITAPLGVAAAALSNRETVVREVASHHFGLKDYFEMIMRPDMRRIIVADFCLALGPGWMSSLYLFYFHDSRGFTIAEASSLLFIYIAAGVLGAAGLSALAQKLGKHRTLQVASTLYSLGLVMVAVVPRGNYLATAALMLVLGFLAAGFPLLDRAMVADVGDAVLLEKGKQRTALLYAMITTTQKLAGSASIGLSYILLGAIGYKAGEGVHNTPAAVGGMELVYIVVPVVFVMLGGACYFGYALDSRRHADIRAALDAREAA